MSGTDAALAFAWHLASCTDDALKPTLSNVVVLIDPLMNPDGRDRCITLINQNRTNAPSVDDQSIIHAEAWPSGRMNHYLFDMNRDWIFATQPETRGRITAINQWNPHYFMESHEQDPQDTFLFMPPREPVNPSLSKHVRDWEARFAGDQAKAFDSHGWRYYTGEWNEGWYPGYSGSWAATRGMVDNLYEQARILSDGVRRYDGTIEAYRESVHKQLVSSLANLDTLQKNRADVLKGYLADRRANLAPDGPQGRKLFALAGPSNNPSRFLAFVDSLKLQGIEIYAAGADFNASGKDWLGKPVTDMYFAKGTWLIPAAQPLAGLVRAMFDLDPRMPSEFLTDERRELLRMGQSKLYDITGWNLAMLAGIPIWELDAPLPAGSPPADFKDWRSPPRIPDDSKIAYFINGADDRSVAVTAHLLERGINVRILDKPTTLAMNSIPRGSAFVFLKDNPAFQGDLKATLIETAAGLGASVSSVTTGLSPGDNPDLGSAHLVLLSPPRIAVMTRDPFNPYTAGEIWHLIDQELGIRASYLNAEGVTAADLRRYNVIVIPDGGADVASKMIDSLKAWTEAGGTLISIGSSCQAFTADKIGIGSTRLLTDVLTKRDDYRVSIIRDWLGKTWSADPDIAWSQTVPDKIEYPWAIDGDSPSEDEAKRRDAWRFMFMPQGAVLAARTDDRSYLTAGASETLPVIYAGNTVLIPSSGMNAPVLMGALVPAEPKAETKAETKPDAKANTKPQDASPSDKNSKTQPAASPDNTAPEPKSKDEPQHAKLPTDGPRPDSTKQNTGANLGETKNTDHNDTDKSAKDEKSDKDEKKEPKPGWTVAPPGYELRLRMSGLLWPEAADRIAHSAYLTREPIGAGQLIMFANSPTFRSATPATKRLFANALIYGPGMGTSQPLH